jgi:hypothetical protein
MILLIGCGRVGFDSGPSDAPALARAGGGSLAMTSSTPVTCRSSRSATTAGKLAASAHWIRGVADGDGAWITWVDDSTGQQLRDGRLSGDGTLPRMSVGLGQLDTSLGHYHTLQRVRPSAVALWTETTTNRTFSAMRVCF